MRFSSTAVQPCLCLSMVLSFQCFSLNCSALLLPRSRVAKILLSGIALSTASAFVLPVGYKSSSSREETKMASSKSDKMLRVLLNGGDNMLGRAVQLSFPVQAPGEENIWDSCPASHYLDMCLHPSGKSSDLSINEIRKLNAEGKYLWGDYLSTNISPPPDLRILNFESAITRSIKNSDVPTWKGIRYHTHVDNLEPVMRAFVETTHGGNAPSPVVFSFANNHCMDYGRQAFEAETLPALAAASSLFKAVGCGKDWDEATKPAVIQCGEGTTVEVFALSSGCSGTPELWWAKKNRSGLVGLPGIYNKRAVEDALRITKEAIRAHGEVNPQTKNRLRIVSIHWGPNWAMKGEDENEIAARREFGHRLIDECGVDLIYGHSSHHCRGMEVYNGKLILYGTGDMINDYEGFENRGEERYNRLGGVYVVDMNKSTGMFEQLHIIPTFMNRLRLERYTKESQMWKPNARRLEVDGGKNENFAVFLNEMSLLDAGSRDTALVVKHVESDPEIPGGPILESEKCCAA